MQNTPAVWPRVLIGLALVAIPIAALFLLGGDRKLIATLVQHEASFRQWFRDYPTIVYSFAFLIYVTVTGLSIPAATGLSLFYAWYFGFWPAVVVVSFASTSGATVAFLLSRFVFRDPIQRRFGEQLADFNNAFEREGAVYLLSLRLQPIVPFFVVNAVMGLTPIRVRSFWWASQVGMLPGTLVYVYAGSRAPDLRTMAEQGLQGLPWIQIFCALTLLALLPILARWLVAQLRRKQEVT